jgi:hypothetical protein
MLRAIYATATKGDTGAIDRILRIMERRAKLWGLDTPVRNEHTGKDGGPIAFKGALATYELGADEAGTIFDELAAIGALQPAPDDAAGDAIHSVPSDA